MIIKKFEQMFENNKNESWPINWFDKIYNIDNKLYAKKGNYWYSVERVGSLDDELEKMKIITVSIDLSIILINDKILVEIK